MAPAFGPAFPRHVAAGCLAVGRSQTGLSDEQWAAPDRQRWAAFPRHDRLLDSAASALRRPTVDLSESPQAEPQGLQLPSEVKDLLLRSKALSARLLKLFQHHWVELEFRVSSDDPDTGLCRVFLLPDDVDRRLVNRSNGTLRKSWIALLLGLDYSQSAWRGEAGGTPVSHPQHSSPGAPGPGMGDGGDDGAGDSESLLQMFNTIPSPDPQSSVLNHDYDRESFDSLMESNIRGLETTLYPYQRRSAALMLQRELQPFQVLDPRLSPVVDQIGVPWYYDAVTGTVLRDGRFYDGVSGGILAEEMGAGKTLMCLALILATRNQPARIPELYGRGSPTVRPRVGSLADMAAAAGSRGGVPWRSYFYELSQAGLHYENCLRAVERNSGSYLVPRPEPRRKTRQPPVPQPPTRVFLSRASLVIVPPNLLQQWRDEIGKHTSDLKVLVLAAKQELPAADELALYEVVLMAITRLERLFAHRVADANGNWALESPIAEVHFKRIIVDEGHKLGNSKIYKKSNVHLILEHIHASSRWIVTGTPSTGLFGVDDSDGAVTTPSPASDGSASGGDIPYRSRPWPKAASTPAAPISESSDQQERKDLERIGSIAALYLNARPWSNTAKEDGDTPADWTVYVMQPKHSARSVGRYAVLKATLDSLIIRHRKSEIGNLLPPVNKKVVYLDGSYQDKLALNLFSMMIIFNSVQSQRTDQDFFFHPRQRKSLLQLVSNLRQASFFGGSFFSEDDIVKAVNTAIEFLEANKVPLNAEDERLVRDAIALGQTALRNKVKLLANRFHEVPVYVRDFPGGDIDDVSRSWSIDEGQGDTVCIDAPMILALQRFVRPWLSSPELLATAFNSGYFGMRGQQEKDEIWLGQDVLADPPRASQASGASSAAATLAGNTKLGDDAAPMKPRAGSRAVAGPVSGGGDDAAEEIAECLAKARLISTASAKLSYLLDSIAKYQGEEKILVFYESENVAWYLAGYLEVLHIPHLIYAKSLSPQRRARYVATFNESPTFRVMLMDLTQAAFGLDMRSASRIYFINPVLNPQVEAQAIGRVRRISQKKDVSVETLVLRDSLEEKIIERRENMTQAEHRKCKSILDDKPLYNWFLNAKIIPLPGANGGSGDENAEPDDDGQAQMALLSQPLPLFGRSSGRIAHPDEGLVIGGDAETQRGGTRRLFSALEAEESNGEPQRPAKRRRPAKGVRFAETADDNSE